MHPSGSEFVRGDGVMLHVVRAGNGPAVLLLHGFPEFWRSWSHQIPALASAGFSVHAPDLRGYHESDQPTQPGAYHIIHLVADVAALVGATGHARAHIVGHDWGGILAWTFATMHPELVDRLVILNAPHMAIYSRHMQKPSRQWLRSWYVPLFLVPWLAERILTMRDFHVLRELFRRQPARPAFSNADITAYIEALAKPGAVTAALRWYRDNTAADATALLRSAHTTAPTLVIWGERDASLGVELLDGLEQYAPSIRIHRIEDASHWVQNEAPDEVNRVLIDFLSGSC